MRRTFVIGSILCAGAFIGAYLVENLRLPLAMLAFAIVIGWIVVTA